MIFVTRKTGTRRKIYNAFQVKPYHQDNFFHMRFLKTHMSEPLPYQDCVTEIILQDTSRAKKLDGHERNDIESLIKQVQ